MKTIILNTLLTALFSLSLFMLLFLVTISFSTGFNDGIIPYLMVAVLIALSSVVIIWIEIRKLNTKAAKLFLSEIVVLTFLFFLNTVFYKENTNLFWFLLLFIFFVCSLLHFMREKINFLEYMKTRIPILIIIFLFIFFQLTLLTTKEHIGAFYQY